MEDNVLDPPIEGFWSNINLEIGCVGENTLRFTSINGTIFPEDLITCEQNDYINMINAR